MCFLPDPFISLFLESNENQNPCMIFYFFLFLRPPSLRDLESLEPAFYNSLLWIQENDPEPLDLTFTIEEEAFGQVRKLKQNELL